jgi:ABC-type antimicrobial peptide transport system permease subunit
MKVDNGKEEIELMTETMNADPDYFNIYKLKLLTGRFPVQSDTLKEYLVNESFTKAFGFSTPADAIGKFVKQDKKFVPIVGVLKNFHTKSTHDPIKPVVYASARNNSYNIHIALKSQAGSPGMWKAGLEKIEKEFKKLYPEDPDFKYKFFDETIASFYKKEQDVSRLLKWSAGLCIFISCLGLLGLVIYTTNTRTKEIGVRKVLGASVVQIVSLLSKDLLSLVMIAFIIATPLAWLAMNNWLQDFAYRISIGWWVFVAAGSLAIIIAFVTIGSQAVKAGIANPMKSLRTE